MASRTDQIRAALPSYRCHKIVKGEKITAISDDGMLELGRINYRVLPGKDYFKRNSPKPGGYYVLYENGYESCSPAAPFESGYTRIDESGDTIITN